MRRLAPRSRVLVRPVFSNFGEPALASGRNRRARSAPLDDLRRHRIDRALASLFPQRQPLIAEPFAPRELLVVGGAENPGSARCWPRQKISRRIISGGGGHGRFRNPGLLRLRLDRLFRSPGCSDCGHPQIDRVRRLLRARGDSRFSGGRLDDRAARRCVARSLFVAPGAQISRAKPSARSSPSRSKPGYGRNASGTHLARNRRRCARPGSVTAGQGRGNRLFVVHWNQPASCVATVKALCAQGIPLRVTVIDNNSETESFQRLQSGTRFLCSSR